ncbi:hypothetical protein BO83DRAFT_50890 [Aspergillus eucalypticola CBS 122712]|uniref:Uncharacterized protein n=1 Tax=Aspergillus eucalypticola (strain CBS 122712 / IBT 29274) TaxID=1448314 RepID=A0A317VCX3_ASPEC|nr:uncharacterized protein BO83DRAFT_50890 [Aspergillus eucalypticola CBS 122712]PWY71279.1 hypothetical protein BO83DRAFT_50890 [Aspergillus eucalypticola CBS 122712]
MNIIPDSYNDKLIIWTCSRDDYLLIQEDFYFLLSLVFWMAVLPSRLYTRHGSEIRADVICPMSEKFVLCAGSFRTHSLRRR